MRAPSDSLENRALANGNPKILSHGEAPNGTLSGAEQNREVPTNTRVEDGNVRADNGDGLNVTDEDITAEALEALDTAEAVATAKTASIEGSELRGNRVSEDRGNVGSARAVDEASIGQEDVRLGDRGHGREEGKASSQRQGAADEGRCHCSIS